MSRAYGLIVAVLCCAALAACAERSRGDMPLDDFPRRAPARSSYNDYDDEVSPEPYFDAVPVRSRRPRYRTASAPGRATATFVEPSTSASFATQPSAEPFVSSPPAEELGYPLPGGMAPRARPPAFAPPPMYPSGPVDPALGAPSPALPPCAPLAYDLPWTWQLLPAGLIWHSYLAGVREARVASVFNYQSKTGWLWDPTIGARVGLLRYGTPNAFRPDGWQLDVEGAAFPELLVNQNWDLHSADFRVGVPLTYGAGPLQFKFAWYHLSSHLGDEFIVSHPDVQRINFSRNALVFGTSYFPTDNLRLYGEVGWAYYTDGGSQPWEFQFGTEYSPIFRPGWIGAPFAAVNGHLRQEVNFGGALTVQAGWQWLNAATGTRLRFGFQYFNGKNEQYQFFNQFVQQFGIGLWYDF